MADGNGMFILVWFGLVWLLIADVVRVLQDSVAAVRVALGRQYRLSHWPEPRGGAKLFRRLLRRSLRRFGFDFRWRCHAARFVSGRGEVKSEFTS